MKITDINDPRVPQWFKDAQKQKYRWHYDTDEKSIVWQDGIWKQGTWQKGKWQNGTWQKGIWQCGLWQKGTWKDGIWKWGVWYYGTWQDGTWQNGNWQDGTWFNGIRKDGYWYDGIWYKGQWIYGWLKDIEKIGNYQDDWQWQVDWVKSPINPKQYFKDTHIPRQLRLINNLQKYMKMSDQQLVRLVGFDSVQQWLDEWYYDQFNKQQFLIQHKDDLNQSIYKLIRRK